MISLSESSESYESAKLHSDGPPQCGIALKATHRRIKNTTGIVAFGSFPWGNDIRDGLQPVRRSYLELRSAFGNLVDACAELTGDPCPVAKLL